MNQVSGHHTATEPCPGCGEDIEVVFQFVSHYADWYGAWESDVEYVNDPSCPTGCNLTRHQWDDLLVKASEKQP